MSQQLPHEYVKIEGQKNYTCKHCGVPTLNPKAPSSKQPCPARPA